MAVHLLVFTPEFVDGSEVRCLVSQKPHYIYVFPALFAICLDE